MPGKYNDHACTEHEDYHSERYEERSERNFEFGTCCECFHLHTVMALFVPPVHEALADVRDEGFKSL